MFNSPLLDVTIGLVFIFLLYSLLATSITEAIATLFSLRARMLKNAIITGMLSNTSTDGRWKSILKGFGSFFLEIIRLISGIPGKEQESEKIGHKFFDHPLIKNYGSSRIFPLPSYIPTKNFSTVLIDILKNEFYNHLDAIAQKKVNKTGNTFTISEITQNLQNSSDAVQLKELFNYYEDFYCNRTGDLKNPVIDAETIQILQMHLQNSIYNIEKFIEKIEEWFNDSMKRAGGWYKRQTQMILFIIGLFLAITFNVDIIQIAGKLSTDKNARDKLMQLSIQAVDKYKDDPRVRKRTLQDGTIVNDTNKISVQNNVIVFNNYKQKIDSINNMMKHEIDSTNNILAIGWGDYGKNTGTFCKIKYIICQTTTSPKRILGFLLLAFAVSLGAPFWFDLLNKLVKLRGSGKKEDESDAATSSTTVTAQTPVNVTINTQQAGEEAAG